MVNITLILLSLSIVFLYFMVRDISKKVNNSLHNTEKKFMDIAEHIDQIEECLDDNGIYSD